MDECAVEWRKGAVEYGRLDMLTANPRFGPWALILREMYKTSVYYRFFVIQTILLKKCNKPNITTSQIHA